MKLKEQVYKACRQASKNSSDNCFCIHDVIKNLEIKVDSNTIATLLKKLSDGGYIIKLFSKYMCKSLDRAHFFYRMGKPSVQFTRPERDIVNIEKNRMSEFDRTEIKEEIKPEKPIDTVMKLLNSELEKHKIAIKESEKLIKQIEYAIDELAG